MIVNPHIFNRDWFARNQRVLLFFCNWYVTRYVVRRILSITHIIKFKDRIDKLSTNNFRIVNNDGSYSQAFFTKARFSIIMAYQLRHFVTALHWFDMNIANQYIPQLNCGFDNATYYPDAHIESTSVDGDAIVDNCNMSWAQIIGANGTLSNDDGNNLILASTTARTGSPANRFNINIRGIALFDSSGLDDSAVISAASFNFDSITNKADALGTFDLHCILSSCASNTALVAADYQAFTRTNYGSIAWADISDSVWNRLSFNSTGIASVSKTGISKYMFMSSWDYSQSFGGTWVAGANSAVVASSADTTSDPYLYVTYTIPTAYVSHTIL